MKELDNDINFKNQLYFYIPIKIGHVIYKEMPFRIVMGCIFVYILKHIQNYIRYYKSLLKGIKGDLTIVKRYLFIDRRLSIVKMFILPKFI